MVRLATIALVVALAAVTVGGCGKLFSDGSGQNNGSVTGIGPDGGVCTKDPVVIKNVMLAPPVCSATAPCPCGTFCSSQTGGNCIADCVDDTWCAPGYACSPYGQCLKAAADGGTGDAGALDPSCPRNTTLLDSIKTAPRACAFDDICPFGSFCNHVTELCDWSCKFDSDCAGMNSSGHTFVCGCLGQCAEVGASQTAATTVLPTLEVSPKQYVFVRPATITTPVWGAVASRTVNLTAVAQSVTTWPPAADFTVRAAGGAELTTASYNYRGSGPGANLSLNGNGALPLLDGVAMNVGDRYLVKDISFPGFLNGIYVVTSLGSASSPWLLTRAADYDTASPSEVRVGAKVRVTAGTANGNRTFVLSSFSGAVDVGVQSYTGVEFTVRLATTAALNVTPGGPVGVGRTLTAVGNGALTVDGVLTALSDRILLKNQVDAGFASSDGIYTLTQQGTASLPAILTRAADYDTASPSEVRAGANVRATAGTANANTTFILTAFAGAVDVAPQRYVSAVAGTTVIGPVVTIQANPGPGLMVQCPPATTLSATPCSVSIDPSTFTLVNGVFRSLPIAITVGPSSGAPTATSWDLRLDSNNLANAPRAINLRYADAVSPANVATSFQAVATPDPAFIGVGSVHFTTPTGVPMTIPVKARTFNSRLVLFDETRQLSPSGKIVLITPVGTDPMYIQEYLDPGQTGAPGLQQAADPGLADSLDGGRLQKIISYTINQDTVTGNLAGTFKREIIADATLFEAPGFAIAQLDTPADMTFSLAKAPTGPNVPPLVATCTTDAQCLPGLHCDLGLCSSGAIHRFVSASAPWTPAALTLFGHRRMDHWGPHTLNNGSTIGYKGLYLPGSYLAASVASFKQVGPMAPISGELTANLYDASNALVAGSTPQVAIPLLTQHDSPWPMPASQLLSSCLLDLAREPRSTLGAAPTNEAYDTSTSCINLGRVDVALGDMKTFQHALQGWLQVHSFVEREGLEEALMTEGLEGGGLSTIPTAPLEQILGAGEGGLGLLAELIYLGAYQSWNLGPANTWSYLDFRPQSIQTCTVATDCNGGAGGAQLMSCSLGLCTPLPFDQLPQHEQPIGVPPMILEMTASYLKVMEAYLNKVGRQTYGQPADNSPSSPRVTALTRFGSGMRLALLAEQIAVGINSWAAPCPAGNLNCAAINKRFNAARDEMNAARSRVVAQGEALRTSANPFGIPEDDVPLFFGDPTGTNSRYFAASDYLIDGWASPAVAQAASTLDSARAAWISKAQELVQDQQNKHNRQQELSQLMSKYGGPILANCGNLSVPDGTGGYHLLDSGEVIPYFDDPTAPTRTLSNDTCFIDSSCLPPNDQRDAMRLGLAANFLDASGNLLPGDPSTPTVGPKAADYFVRSEVCKVSWFGDPYDPLPRPLAENYPLLVSNVCPREMFFDLHLSASPCTVTKGASDGNLYFSSLGTPSIPVAALYGPIKRGDLGTYYKYTTAPVIVGSTRFDVGPDDNNVFNYIEFRTDQSVPDWPSAANHFTSSYQFTRLEDGELTSCQNPYMRTDRDYPRPSLSVLPPACYKGSLGVAFYEVQTNNLRLQRAKDVLDIGKKNLEDTLNQCALIDSDNATLDNLTTSYKSMKKDYEMASVFAAGVTSELSPGGIASFGLSVIGQAVADEAAQIQQMEAKFARTEKAQDCWNNFRAQRRGMSTALADIQIATSQVNSQGTTFRNLQAANTINLQEGKAAWEREQQSPLGSLSHHFWVDEKVERFRKELEWARRLTFAAMRAVEYDFQQSLPLRSQIVTATTPSQLEEVMLGLKQEQAARTINRRRPDEASIVVSLRDDVLGIASRTADPAGERNWTPAQRFASRLWDQTYAYRDSKGNYLGQGIPFTLGPQDILQTRCGERLWRATATLQGDGLDASAPGASVLLLKRNTFQSQFCAGKAPTTTPLANSATPTMQVGVVHTSAQLFEPGSAIDLSDANQFTAALLYPWFNVRKTDFYKTTYQDGASEELAGRGLYGDYVLLFPKQMLDDSFTLNRVEDVLLRLDYLSVDNLSQ